jgi:hypothetical protein
MTDGPQKSLPMNRNWKRVAERLANENSSVEEVVEAVSQALMTSERIRIIDRLRSLIAPGAQGSLFLGDTRAMLSGVRTLGYDAASSFARNIMDFCEANLAASRDSFAVFQGAVAYALKSEAESHFRGITEHWFRKAPQAGGSMRRRCLAAGTAMDFAGISELFLSGRGGRPIQVLRKNSLDDGVPL